MPAVSALQFGNEAFAPRPEKPDAESPPPTKEGVEQLVYNMEKSIRSATAQFEKLLAGADGDKSEAQQAADEATGGTVAAFNRARPALREIGASLPSAETIRVEEVAVKYGDGNTIRTYLTAETFAAADFDKMKASYLQMLEARKRGDDVLAKQLETQISAIGFGIVTSLVHGGTDDTRKRYANFDVADLLVILDQEVKTDSESGV